MINQMKVVDLEEINRLQYLWKGKEKVRTVSASARRMVRKETIATTVFRILTPIFLPRDAVYAKNLSKTLRLIELSRSRSVLAGARPICQTKLTAHLTADVLVSSYS